jgi:polysaccharide biosynthesis transport protein
LQHQEFSMDMSPDLAGPTRLSDTVGAVAAMFRRRWLTLALVTAGLFAVAAVLIMLITPKYEAMARVQIDPSRDPLASAQAEGQSLASEAIETEVTVLNSLSLAQEVVRRLNLANDPEYTKGLDGGSGAERLTGDARAAEVASRVQRGLSVRRDRLTYVIDVAFTAKNANKSANVANAFAEAYLDTKVGSRVGTAERQAAFFRRQLSQLAAEVRAADTAVAQYRAAHGITEGTGSSTIVDQQIAPLSTQIATAEAAAAEARSNLNAARAQIASGGLDSVAEVRSSPVISDLRRQRAEVLRNLGEIQSRYGEKHPESIKVREQLAGLDTQIRAEAQRAVSSLEAAARAADAQVASLRGSLRGLQREQARDTRAGVQAQSLEQDAATKRAQYEKLSQMSLESTQGARSQIASASIIDRATPPTRPSWPNRPLLLALALLVALSVGFATIVVQQMLVSGLRSTEDFRGRFGLPVLAAVPQIKGKASPAELIVERPTSMFAEALRIARASILASRGGETPPKVIAITSSLPHEGKTTTSLAFARVLALQGARTVLVDCDVRRASLRLLTPGGSSAGLVELLAGSAGLEQAAAPDAIPGLDTIIVREPHFSADDAFAGQTMERLLDELRRRYDLVVLDLPPIIGLADGRYLAGLADAVVMAVKWDATPMNAVETSMGHLQGDGSRVVGAIYTMVDPLSEAGGGLYYSRKYAKYY